MLEQILSTLVAIPSVTGRPQPAHELVDYVADFVAKRGLHIERFIFDGYESLVATTRPNDKTPLIMLAAHGDVVDAPDELFELQRDGDTLYGRGVLDMKGALAVFLQVLDDLQAELPDLHLGFTLTMDEENGGERSTVPLLAEGYRPNVAVLPDGGDNWRLQKGSKGVWILKVTATGKSTHGSRNWEGVNAIERLLAIIPEIKAIVPEEQGPDTNTLVISTFNAGSSTNQVPAEASLTVDIRTVNLQEYNRVYDEMLAICQEHDLELTILSPGLPTNFDLSDPYIVPFIKHMEEVLGAPVNPMTTLASGDQRYYADYDIPCISVYPKGGSHHSDQEWVSMQALEQLREITKRYIHDIHNDKQLNT